MELRQLRTFERVADCGSFSRAAELLNLTQPAVTSQIQGLERELGLRLLERLPRRLLLTEAGEILLGYARKISNLEDEAGRVLAELKGLETGCLRVGASPTIGMYVLPRMLGEFKRRHSGLRLVAEIEPTHRVAEALEAHALDVGLVEAAVNSPALAAESFMTDDLVLVVAAAHPWAHRRSVRPDELPSCPLVAREPASGTRALVEERLHALGVDITPALELGGVEAIKNAVAAGLGFSFVSRQALSLESRVGTLAIVSVPGLDLQRPFFLLLDRHRYVSPALRAFVDFVRESGEPTPPGASQAPLRHPAQGPRAARRNRRPAAATH